MPRLTEQESQNKLDRFMEDHPELTDQDFADQFVNELHLRVASQRDADRPSHRGGQERSVSPTTFVTYTGALSCWAAPRIPSRRSVRRPNRNASHLP
jgi:hypothetical protein